MTTNAALEDYEVNFNPKPRISPFYQGGPVGIIIDLITQLDFEKQLGLLQFLAGAFGFILKEKE